MSRLVLFALFLVVSLDFSMPDALLAVAGARSVQWDDEEESVPARRERLDGEERRVSALPVAMRSVEAGQTQPSTERRAHADRLHGQTVWRLPFRQALTLSVRAASPPDDH
jgi:hypothetical protein